MSNKIDYEASGLQSNPVRLPESPTGVRSRCSRIRCVLEEWLDLFDVIGRVAIGLTALVILLSALAVIIYNHVHNLPH